VNFWNVTSADFVGPFWNSRQEALSNESERDVFYWAESLQRRRIASDRARSVLHAKYEYVVWWVLVNGVGS